MGSSTLRLLSAVAAALLAVLLPSAGAPAQAGAPDAAAPVKEISEETVDFFKANCVSCHTIGGGALAGPDLKGLLERRDREWLVRFILDPKAVIDGGDPYAQELFRVAKGTYMPTLATMTRDRAGKLLDLVEVESAKEKSRFAGLQISDRPLTPADVALGRDLFSGRRAFASGAPACAGCHDVAGMGAFGGGRLGPDLTDVYARLEGRKSLGAWLGAPPAATMMPVFRDRPLDGEEILALVAYLKDASEAGAAAGRDGLLLFLLAGLGGAAGILVVFDFLWRGRFRGVRRALVEGSTR